MKQNQCMVFAEVDGYRHEYEMHSFLSSFHYLLARMYSTNSGYSSVYGIDTSVDCYPYIAFSYESEPYFWQQGVRYVSPLITHMTPDFGFNSSSPNYTATVTRDTGSHQVTATLYSEYTNISGVSKTIKSIQLCRKSIVNTFCSDQVNIEVPAGSKVRVGYTWVFSSNWTRNLDSFLKNETGKDTSSYVGLNGENYNRVMSSIYFTGGSMSATGKIDAGIVLSSTACTLTSNEHWVPAEIGAEVLSRYKTSFSINKGTDYSETVISRVFFNKTANPVSAASAGFYAYYDGNPIMYFKQNFAEPIVIPANQSAEITMRVRVP